MEQIGRVTVGTGIPLGDVHKMALFCEAERVPKKCTSLNGTHWNAYLTIEIGANIAELYTNAHEFGFPSNFESEHFLGTKMDLYNNLQGCKIGAITSKDSVYEVIKSAVISGQMVKIQGESFIPTNDDMKFEAI